jgi:hypothetical protein
VYKDVCSEDLVDQYTLTVQGMSSQSDRLPVGEVYVNVRLEGLQVVSRGTQVLKHLRAKSGLVPGRITQYSVLFVRSPLRRPGR